MRKLVIGDVHGGLKSLVQALERALYNPEKDMLIFLGDYVDGWSESSELIEYLINLDSEAKYKSIFLLGNHDKWCKDWLNNGQTPMIWTQQGGQATINSYIKTGYLTKDSHREFFNKCLNYYIDDENRGFCHGGFTSRKGLGHDPYEANYYWDRDLWQLALMSDGRIHEEVNLVKEGVSSGKRFENHKEIFIGHTSTINWNNKPHYREYNGTNEPITIPMNRCNVWNMDTGGGFNGKVTVMDIDTKEYFQSDYVKELYPNELGR